MHLCTYNPIQDLNLKSEFSAVFSSVSSPNLSFFFRGLLSFPISPFRYFFYSLPYIHLCNVHFLFVLEPLLAIVVEISALKFSFM